MAEIRKLVCDMCGRDIKDGYVFKPSSRRRISNGTTSSGAYRFDLCDACLGQIQKACKARKEAQAQPDRDNYEQSQDGLNTAMEMLD